MHHLMKPTKLTNNWKYIVLYFVYNNTIINNNFTFTDHSSYNYYTNIIPNECCCLYYNIVLNVYSIYINVYEYIHALY